MLFKRFLEIFCDLRYQLSRGLDWDLMSFLSCLRNFIDHRLWSIALKIVWFRKKLIAVKHFQIFLHLLWGFYSVIGHWHLFILYLPIDLNDIIALLSVSANQRAVLLDFKVDYKIYSIKLLKFSWNCENFPISPSICFSFFNWIMTQKVNSPFFNGRRRGQRKSRGQHCAELHFQIALSEYL